MPTANTGETRVGDPIRETKVEFGEFPFPLTEGPDESRYLTWLRNNSNYMAVRGFVDYLRAVGVLVRGIIVNFLIFLPYLMVIAIVLGYSHHWMLDHPFLVTLVVLLAALGWVLLFPILMPLFKIFSYQKSLETGSESSVKQRDLYERSFGGLLLAIIAVALLEALPWALESLHDLIHSKNFGWKGSVGTVAGALAILSSADKILSGLSGARKKAAMVLIGAVGLLFPLLLILYATDFLLYGPVPGPIVMYSPMAVPVLGVLAIMTAIPLGLWRRAFSLRESTVAVGMLLAGLMLISVVVFAIGRASGAKERGYVRLLPEIIDPLQRVASAFDEVSTKEAMTEEVAVLVNEVILAEGEYKRMEKEVDRDVKKYYEKDWEARSGAATGDGNFVDWCKQFVKLVRTEEKYAQWDRQYFTSGQRFITLGDKLSAQPPGSLEPLRREIARLAYVKLLEKLESNFEPAEQKVAEQKVGELLRRKFIELHLPDFHEQQSFEEDEQQSIEELVALGLERARSSLDEFSIEEIANMVGEAKLVKSAKEQFRDLPGKQELARLIRKEELAQLFSKEELVDMLLPKPSEAERQLIIPRARAKFIKDIFQIERDEVLSLAVMDVNDDSGYARAEATAKLQYAKFLVAKIEPDPDAQVKPAAEAIDQQLAALARGEEGIVAQVAREELASLALEDFDVDHLKIFLDRQEPELEPGAQEALYRFRQDVPSPEETAKAEEFKDLQQLATKSRLAELVEVAFPDSAAADASASRSSTKFVEQVYRLSRLDMRRLLLAEKVYVDQPARRAKLAREILAEKALTVDLATLSAEVEAARVALGDVYRDDDSQLRGRYAFTFDNEELARFAVAKFEDRDFSTADAPDKLVSAVVFGKYGPLERDEAGSPEGGRLGSVKKELTDAVMRPKAIFVALLAGVIWLGCWFTVDVNLTSIHGLYRDRLASAFLVGQDTKGDVDIEKDLDLEELCRYEARSTSPYHLVNVALNLQGSKDIGIRDRNSDFFVFSKRFVGSERTGYCRSETLEQIFPQMSLATAMAISAAAASPNMGRGTSPLLVAFMTLLNIRLGYWMPNPGLLEEKQNRTRWKQRKKDPKLARQPLGFTFEEVFWEELKEIERRWAQVDPEGSQRSLDENLHELRSVMASYGIVDEEEYIALMGQPTVNHGLVGIGFSGGGIRSATINLGITQALHKRGVFDHVDYMSTVSGGGYLGSSISTLMRSRTKLVSEIEGTLTVETEQVSEIAGTVSIQPDPRNSTEQIVVVTPIPTAKEEKQEAAKKKNEGQDDKKQEQQWAEASAEYHCSIDAKLAVTEGQTVREGQVLYRAVESEQTQLHKQNMGDQFVTVSTVRAEEEVKRTYRFSKDAALNVRNKDSVGAGKPLLKPRDAKSQSEIPGSVSVEHTRTEQIVKVQGRRGDGQREYRFSRFEQLLVKTGDTVKPGQALVQRHNTFGKRFMWRVRPFAFLREMSSRLDEKHAWVNVSDGGHIENLATIELLRRRCKYIIIGDGEADPKLHFAGLATLMRSAYIDLGIKIKIDLEDLRLRKAENGEHEVSGEHWALGKITYPKTGERGVEEGYLLYLKSSFTGDEIEVIQEYRHRNPSFPHQTTADQFFDEGQFEAYRALGQHIGEKALPPLPTYELRLMAVTDRTRIPSTKSLVIVAKKENQLSFYINDANGKRVVTKHEIDLATRNEDLKQLKEQLEPLWKSKDLNAAVKAMAESKKANTIDAVRSLVGHPKMSFEELDAWFKELKQIAQKRTNERKAAEAAEQKAKEAQ